MGRILFSTAVIDNESLKRTHANYLFELNVLWSGSTRYREKNHTCYLANDIKMLIKRKFNSISSAVAVINNFKKWPFTWTLGTLTRCCTKLFKLYTVHGINLTTTFFIKVTKQIKANEAHLLFYILFLLKNKCKINGSDHFLMLKMLSKWYIWINAQIFYFPNIVFRTRDRKFKR